MTYDERRHTTAETEDRALARDRHARRVRGAARVRRRRGRSGIRSPRRSSICGAACRRRAEGRSRRRRAASRSRSPKAERRSPSPKPKPPPPKPEAKPDAQARHRAQGEAGEGAQGEGAEELEKKKQAELKKKEDEAKKLKRAEAKKKEEARWRKSAREGAGGEAPRAGEDRRSPTKLAKEQAAAQQRADRQVHRAHPEPRQAPDRRAAEPQGNPAGRIRRGADPGRRSARRVKLRRSSGVPAYDAAVERAILKARRCRCRRIRRCSSSFATST